MGVRSEVVAGRMQHKLVAAGLTVAELHQLLGLA